MNPLQLIMMAINGLSVLTNNPKIVGSHLRLEQASELLGLLGEIVARGEEGYRELKEFAEEVGRMAAESRAPTPAEWANLRARSDAAHKVIQEARKRAEAEEATANPPEVEPPVVEPPVVEPAPPTEPTE